MSDASVIERIIARSKLLSSDTELLYQSGLVLEKTIYTHRLGDMCKIESRDTMILKAVAKEAGFEVLDTLGGEQVIMRSRS